MKPASYSVVRYVADPARNEPINVGVILWDDQTLRLRIEDDGIQRVIRDNPYLDPQALDFLEEYVTETLLDRWPSNPELVEVLLREQSGFPVEFTEPRSVAIEDLIPEGFDLAHERLIHRIVRTRHRTRGATGMRTETRLRRRWQPYIERGIVLPNHKFSDTESLVVRTVDFYANSEVNVVFDSVNLRLSRPNDVRQIADAEAMKIHDIVQKNELNAFLLLCETRRDPAFAQVNEDARRVLASAGGNVGESFDVTVQQFERLLNIRSASDD